MPAPRVFLGLGSNLGDREAALARAVALLGGRGFRTIARSSLYLVLRAEIAPEVRHPVLGLTAEEMRRRCGDAHEVRRQAAPAR